MQTVQTCAPPGRCSHAIGQQFACVTHARPRAEQKRMVCAPHHLVSCVPSFPAATRAARLHASGGSSHENGMLPPSQGVRVQDLPSEAPHTPAPAWGPLPYIVVGLGIGAHHTHARSLSLSRSAGFCLVLLGGTSVILVMQLAFAENNKTVLVTSRVTIPGIEFLHNFCTHANPEA